MKGINFFLLTLLSFIITESYGQQDSLLFKSDFVKIYTTYMLYKEEELYNAKKDLRHLLEKEKSTQCKVDYSYWYNPLSLVGNYYSYEYGEGGVLACGPPGSMLSVKTIDLSFGQQVPLTEICTESSIIEALKADGWVKKFGDGINVDFSQFEGLEEFMEVFNRSGYVKFNPFSYAVFEYSEERKMVALRWVGQEYIGFNHIKHLQLGLWVKPNPEFESALKETTYFKLGDFENGLITN